MKARPDAVDGALMLFPTLCDIAQTPNGRRLRVSALPFSDPLPLLCVVLLR